MIKEKLKKYLVKRILSFLVTVLMVISMIPISSYAVDNGEFTTKAAATVEAVLVGAAGETGAEFKLTDKTGYEAPYGGYVIKAKGDKVPTYQEVANEASTKNAIVDFTAGDVQNIKVDKLESGKEYVLYVVIQNANAYPIVEHTEVVSVPFTTKAAATVEAVLVGAAGETGAEFKLTDKTGYEAPYGGYVIKAKGEKAPTYQEVANEASTKNAIVDFTAGSVQNIKVDKLESGKEYVLYVVIQNANAYPIVEYTKVVSVPFTTKTATVNGYKIIIPQDIVGGTVTTDKDTYGEGEEVVLTVTPDKGYELATLAYRYKTGLPTDIKATKKFTMPASDATVIVTFEKIKEPVFKLQFTSNQQLKEETYTDFQSAFEAVNNLAESVVDAKLSLIKDEKVDWASGKGQPIDLKHSLTLDLAGHTFEFINRDTKVKSVISITQENVALTVQDTAENGKLIFRSAYGGIRLGVFDYYKTKPHVYFTLESGTLISTNISGTADETAVASDTKNGTIKITGGTVNGLINNGNFEMSGGLIRAASPIGVVNFEVGKYSAQDTEPDKVVITGGTIENTDVKSSDLTGACAVSVRSCAFGGNYFNVTGGTLKSAKGPALYIRNNATQACEMTVGGTAKLVAPYDSAVRIEANKFSEANYLTVRIKNGTKVETGKSVVDILDAAAEDYGCLNIEQGTYFKYGQDTIPFQPSSKFAAYPDGMVLNTKPIENGEFAGYYTLAKKTDLSHMEGTIEISYQNMDLLKTALKGAKPIYDAGNKTAGYAPEHWTAFAAAYEAALPIPQNANANQNEIDFFTQKLGAAQKTMVEEKENRVDLTKLADGTYEVNIDMRYQTDDGSPSMSDGAVNHTAKLHMKDGKGTLEVEFVPMPMLGSYGSLMQFWVFDGATPAEARGNMQASGAKTEVEYLSYLKVDMENATYKPIEGIPAEKPTLTNGIRPAKVRFPLAYMGVTDNQNKIYCHLGVDMMRGEGNVGDQSAIMYIKYSTLKEIQTEITLKVDTTPVTLTKGGTVTRTAEVLGADGYTVTWTSSDDKVATVVDGKITAVAAGTATITVKATKANADTLTKTIKVTVAAEDKTEIKVQGTTVEGQKVSAELTGDVLVSGGNDKVDSNAQKVVADATTTAPGATSAEVVMNANTAKALAETNKALEIKTNVGTVKLDAALMDEVADTNKPVMLEVAKIANPEALGTFVTSFKLELTAGGKKIDFASGTATVTVPCNADVDYAYYIADGKIKEKIPAVYNAETHTASWTTSHFSDWALSAKEYEPGKNEGGSGGGTVNPGFFLEDGNYYVDVALWHFTQNKASMGDVAFDNNRKALVTVKNGEITKVEIATNPVDVSGIHSAIIEMQANGKSVTKVETGSLTTRPANKNYTYIKRASFMMPEESQPTQSNETTYVPVHFTVPDTPMDEVVESLDARLKFTWSTAKATDDTELVQNDTAGKGTSSITGEKIEDVELADKTTGIKLNTDTEALDANVEMEISKPTSSKDFETAKKAMSSVKDDWTLYKITTTLKDKEVQPDGSVTISIPCTDKGLTVYRISESGRKVPIKGGSVKNGYYVFNTSSLGLFAVVGEVLEGKAPTRFTDVPAEYWAYKSIETVVERGLFNGNTKTTFNPEGSMTRAQFVSVLGRLAGVDAKGSGKTSFTDVPADMYYAPYVNWAVENGITLGVTETSFLPDRAISRQEMAVFLARYCSAMKIDLKDGKAPVFTDAAAIGDFAKTAVSEVAAAGLLQGRNDGSFAPRATATRAHVATLMARFIQGYSL